MRELAVWIEGVAFPVGSLTKSLTGTVAFCYSDEWLVEPAAFGISLSLPLITGSFGDALSRAFFSNLLNENDQLNHLLRRERLDRHDLVGILFHLGSDCAGAVSCLAAGAPPVKRPGDLATDYDVIDDLVLAELIKRLASGRALPPEIRDPSPVAGYRRKIALAQTLAGQFAIPKSGSGVPTTHILKIPDPGHRGEAEQEAAAARLAIRCGLDCATSNASTFDGQDILIIERFDRVRTPAGLVLRVHQEDFAQALGLPDDLKYERRAIGSFRFDAAAIATILNRTASPALAQELFLRFTLFNLMIGNSDNHAKNHALLYPFGEAPSLAPLYDMVPIPLGGGYTDEFAFNIGNASRASELTLADLVAFCVTLGISANRAEKILTDHMVDLVARLDRASEGFKGSLRFFDMLIGREINRLLDLFNLDISLRERDYFPEKPVGGWLMS
ncbi:MAG: hypothetical protein RL367_1232 [Pseudomonadota bacterium]